MRWVALALTLAATSACGDDAAHGDADAGAGLGDAGGTDARAPEADAAAAADAGGTDAGGTDAGEPDAGPSELPDVECRFGLSVETLADGSAMDTGDSGLSHGLALVAGARVTFCVTECEGDHPDLGRCRVEGLTPNSSGVDARRCLRDPSTVCRANADCGAAGPCRDFFGPPQPAAAGGVPVCMVHVVDGLPTGEGDLSIGAMRVDAMPITSTLHLSTSIEAPCPVCEGDAATADGERAGTCRGGARDGMPCDAHGAARGFGPSSLDCPPDPFTRAGVLRVDLGPLGTDGDRRTLSTDSPRCRARGDTDRACFCDTCATAAAEPCSSDADCPGGAACGGARCTRGPHAGEACVDAGCPGGACGDDGRCRGGEAEGLACDCPCGVPGVPTTPAACAWSGGTEGCEAEDAPTVRAEGEASPFVDGEATATVGAMFCVPPSGNSVVDTVAGLPGLGRVQMRIRANVVELP